MVVFAIGSSFAQDAGIFESYVILNVKNAGNAYYDMQASTTNADFQGANLGTFTAGSESLVFAGGEVKTYKNNGGDVTGGKVAYSVYSGTPSGVFSEVAFGWIEDLGNGDQKWASTSGTTNIITGLAPGTYTLEVYSEASTNVGTKYSNNGGANYKATFDVVALLSASDTSLSKKSTVIGGKLYPSQKGNLAISVYEMTGKLVKNFNVKADGNAIDLNVAKNGLYLVKIASGSHNEVVKFAK